MSTYLVVGGGIIGLSLAYELSRQGMAVTLVEQGEWGGQASSAAAGMLAPLKEFSEPGPLLDLGLESLRLYPEWVRELEERTGRNVQLSLDGLLTVACEGEEEWLAARFGWQKEAGHDVHWLAGKEARELEPMLGERIVAAIYSPGEGHVNNRTLLDALVTACRLQGVRLLPGCVVGRLNTVGGRVVGAETSAGPLAADQTVVCSGAWAGIMLEMLGVSVPIRPVRGQVAAVSSAGIPLRKVVFGSSGYLTPKKDGRIVLGATEDESGFQREVTLAGLARVLQGVMPYVPALQDAAFLSAWAGLRPAAGDGKPLLGRVPGWDGLYLAGGHFRNGILLSVVTAKKMADLLQNGQEEALQTFAPGRFLR